jgi:hypothetical protein
MKAETARPEVSRTTALAGFAAGATAFRPAAAAYPGAPCGWQISVTPGGKAAHASASVRTMKDVCACATAISHTGIEVHGIPFAQNGEVPAFVRQDMIFTCSAPAARKSPRFPAGFPQAADS